MKKAKKKSVMRRAPNPAGSETLRNLARLLREANEASENQDEVYTEGFPVLPLEPPGELSTPLYRAGSIEHHLDMCESGELRGDEIEHRTYSPEKEWRPDEESTQIMPPLDKMISRFEMNLSEENREGDEMSGDEHSSGMQGGEPELLEQPWLDDGTPGKANLQEIERIEDWRKKGAI
jgi:DNA-binding transcriptional ArsR family regulator